MTVYSKVNSSLYSSICSSMCSNAADMPHTDIKQRLTLRACTWVQPSWVPPTTHCAPSPQQHLCHLQPSAYTLLSGWPRATSQSPELMPLTCTLWEKHGSAFKVCPASTNGCGNTVKEEGMSLYAKHTWHGFDGLVCGCMCTQHGAELPACVLELHQLAWRVIAHDVPA